MSNMFDLFKNTEEATANTEDSNTEEATANTEDSNTEEATANTEDSNTEEATANTEDSNTEEATANTEDSNTEEATANTEDSNTEEATANTEDSNTEEATIEATPTMFNIFGEMQSKVKKTKENTKNKATNKPTNKQPKKKKFEGPRIIKVYGQELFVENDSDISLDDIRKRIVEEFHFPEFSKERTTMSLDEKTGIVVPCIHFGKKG